MANKGLIWTGPPGASIPDGYTQPQQIIRLAEGLTEKQKKDIALAFEYKAYDMGAEYTWRRSMIRLKSSLKSLGMKFIGEMLGDDEIDEYSNLDMVLNDYNAISLAEHLGAINSTAALKLRHSLEIITHYLSDDAERNGEELSNVDAAQLVSNCVKYILGESNISTAMEFSRFRDRLLSETLSLEDPQIIQLLDSPTFHIKTVLSILITALKNEKGAVQEHAMGNLGLLIKPMWNKIPEKEKWLIGNAYRDANAAGDIRAIKGLKNALLRVQGFDYVPENLRSTTFKKAAKAVVEAHFGPNNFYTETPVVANLSKLGSSIPAPAFIECVQAYLCSYLGNSYGHSCTAVRIAEDELKKIPEDRWVYYFGKVIQDDEMILSKLMSLSSSPRIRFIGLVSNSLGFLSESTSLSGDNKRLVDATLQKKGQRIQAISTRMYQKLSG